MKITDDLAYQEGVLYAPQMCRFMESTVYGSIEAAIASKEKLVEKFEEDFGYSREMDVDKFDSNYSRNAGILDGLVEIYKQTSNGTGTENKTDEDSQTEN